MPYAITGIGGRHVVQRKIDGEVILDRVEAEGVTLLCAAPAVVAAILGGAEARPAGSAVPGGVRIVVAGAPPPSKTIERVEAELGWEFMQIYGLTETSPLLTINRAPAEWDELARDERARRLAGPGCRRSACACRRRRGRGAGPVQPRVRGLLGPARGVRRGPRGRLVPHRRRRSIEDGPYTVITDRKKDVIITGGENVSSIEVEDFLYQHPAVAEVAVIGVPDEKWGETVWRWSSCREGAPPTETRTSSSTAATHMAHFKAPRAVEIRQVLARTATGKLQKYKLRQPYWEGRERQVN